MCGIAGVLGIDDQGVLIRAMTDTLSHRGPDSFGFHSNGAFHLGARRLSIVGLSSGEQPVFNETGTVCAVFNGEIYNHRQLRKDMETKGHHFATDTDTEVIVHLYEEFGEDCVVHLRGMFAFAVYDGDNVFLGRDRWGIKPLYLTFDPIRRTFLFASEIKALLQAPALTPALDLQTLADTLALSYTVGDRTFFQGIASLQPGHTLNVRCLNGAVPGVPKRYFDRTVQQRTDISFDEAVERLESVLTNAIESHLDADVEVGLTLSGGIDSSLLAMMISQPRDRPVSTFSVADHDNHPDLVHAAKVAHMAGTKHHPVVLTYEAYLQAIPGIVASEEQPASLFGVPFHILSAKIGQHVKACLHGEGADELFGGYLEYLDRNSRTSYIARRLPLLKELGMIPSRLALETIQRLSGDDNFSSYLERVFDVNMGDALERHHLVPVDKCAMASSVEMRVPYLADDVVDLVRGLPRHYLVRGDIGVRKYILRRLALKRLGPELIDIVLREKLGAPAAGAYFLNRFDKMCETELPDSYVTRHEFGKSFGSKRELLMFDMFVECFMKNRGDAASLGTVEEFMRSRAAASQRSRPAVGAVHSTRSKPILSGASP